MIALLITYSMYRGPTLYPELSGAGAVWIGVLATVLFFGSVLVHELARAGRPARGSGPGHHPVPVRRRDTGQGESREPRRRVLIALVGPLTGGLLAALFGIVAGLGGDALSAPLAGTFGYLAWTNLLLAGFNLVPGFPLDGGRLLRSAIWKATGSLSRATRIASCPARPWAGCWSPAGWPSCWPATSPAGSGSPSSGGSWSRPRSSYQERLQLLRGVEAEDVMADLLQIRRPVAAGRRGRLLHAL